LNADAFAGGTDLDVGRIKAFYNAGATWEADRILKELPETLEAHKSRDWVVMNLDEAKNFFGIPFRKTWLDRLKRR
jgi:hypothetical protein